MFEKLLSKAKNDINTVRSIIKTNEDIRIVIYENKSIERKKSEDYFKLLRQIKQNAPKMTDWRIYDHCAAVTKLYAIYENFVEDLIRDWLMLLPQLCPNYSNLEERIRSTHQLGVGRLLIDLKKKRYEHLILEDVVNGLFDKD